MQALKSISTHSVTMPKNEICEQDYEDFIIGDLIFHSTAWAYPNATINEIDGGIYCSDDTIYEFNESLIDKLYDDYMLQDKTIVHFMNGVELFNQVEIK